MFFCRLILYLTNFNFCPSSTWENINLIKDVDMGGSTPLHWAAYTNSEELLLYILNLDIFQNERERQKFIDKRDHVAGNIYTENVEGINTFSDIASHSVVKPVEDSETWDKVLSATSSLQPVWT